MENIMCKLESYQVAKLVRCRINLKDAKLHDAYYPAHLSVALIDAVFNPRVHYESQVVPIIKRYCRYFGLRWVRTGEDRENLPLATDQETLTDLIAHYKKYGVEQMMDSVFKSRHYSPRTEIPKAKNVYRAALALQKIGIDNLQDAASASPEAIKCALMPLKGISKWTIHMFLMYVGNDDFVKADIHVCNFVNEALGEKVLPEEAERLVRKAAQNFLSVTPRLLSYKIWEYGSHKI